MRNPWIKRFVGFAAFFLPAFVCIVGLQLDRSRFRHDPVYAALVPIVMLSSVLLAALVPATFIMISARSLPNRIGMIVAILCLLALECGVAVYMVLMEGLR